MTPRLTVADCMTRDPVTLEPGTEINRAMARMIGAGVSGAPVTEGGALVGILTAKDCFRAVLHASYHAAHGGTVAEFMAREPVTLDAGLDIVRAAEAFMASAHRRFPVMEDGRLAGIVTRFDLLRAFHEMWR